MSESSSDLERFRQALDREHQHLLEASRSSRFRPPTDLATAQLSLLSDDQISEPIFAEILDLSGDGVRIAISPGPDLRVGQICLLRFQPEAGDSFQLRGEVRWLEASSLILVFGILLLTAEASVPHR
ncbi:MAG: PilZ domain-containing protein [Synechococcaceae cyanobacterium]|nr:PilZ domain-containing protein [Synechococcaceae cyanobacterium]